MNDLPDEVANLYNYRAQSRVGLGNDDDPESVSRAIQLSRATGAAPEYVNSDVEGFDQDNRSYLASEIVKNDPFLQRYVNSHPLAAGVSNDDWGTLGTISKTLQNLGGPRFQAAMNVLRSDRDWVGDAATSARSIFGAAFGGFKEGVSEAPPVGSWMQVDDQTRKQNPQYAAFMDKIANNRLAWSEMSLVGYPLDVLRIGTSGLSRAALEGSRQLYLQLGGSQSGADQFARDIAGMVETELTGQTGRVPLHEPTEAAAQQVARSAEQDRMKAQVAEALRLAEPYLAKGEAPPKGLHPLIDQGHAIQTLIDYENHENAAKEIQKSATLERNPEFFIENFLKQYPDSHLELDGPKVAELYGTKEPEAGDNLLGWVPNIKDQLRNARETGSDIIVPRNEWLARTDGDLRKELRDFTTFRPGGMTQEEAKEASKPTDLADEVPSGWGASGSLDPSEVEGMRRVARVQVLPGEELHRFGRSYAVTPTTEWTANEQKIINEVNAEIQRIVPEAQIAPVRQVGRFVGREQVAEPVQGMYHEATDATPVIIWSLNADTPIGTARHETIHALRRMGYLTNKEWSTLAQAAHDNNWVDKHGIRDRYDNQNIWIEEAIAEEFKDRGAQISRRSEVNTIFGRIRNFLQRVKDAVTRALGFEPSEGQLFREIYSGKVGEREPTTPFGSGGQWTQLFDEADKRELFTPEALGMSKGQYRKLLELAQKRLGEDFGYLNAKNERMERQRLSTEWKENEKEVRAEVNDKLLHRPDLAADSFLRTGELFGQKYRRARIDESFLTPEQKATLDPEHYAQRGVHPDHLARAIGFGSGDEMIEALGNLEHMRELEGLTPKSHFSKILNSETDRLMRQRFRDPEQELIDAKEHILSPTQDQLLDEQLIQIATELKRQIQFKKEDIQDAARRSLSTMTTGQINSTRFLEKVGRLGRAIEKAMTDEEWEDAFEMAQRRQIEFWKAKYAMDAEKDLAKWDRYAKRVRARDPKNMPLDFNNAIQDVMQRAGETVNRTPEDIAREYKGLGHEGLEGFVNQHNHGKSLIIDNERVSMLPQDPDMALESEMLTVSPMLFDPNWRKDVKDMTLDEFTSVFNSVDSLFENAKREGSYIRKGEKFALDEFVDRLIDLLKESKGADVHQYPLGETKTPVMKAYWAALIQMETIFNRIARGDLENPWNKYVNLPTMEAGNELARLERETSREFGAVPAFPKNLNKLVPNHLFFDPLQKGGEIPDRPATLNYSQVLAILQNVGNYSNFDKLTRGYGIPSQIASQWKTGGYQMAMNDPLMSWLFQHTTKQDWDRAQAIGKIFERLFEQAEDRYYGMGARPGARIELRSIETPFGIYDGWYHPVVYDPNRPAAFIKGPNGEVVVGGSKKLARNPFEDGGFYKTSVPNAYQQARTGYAAPILLSFDPIQFKMKQIINDIAMRETVVELNKVFEHPKFRSAMTTYYGKEYTDLLRPYLRDIAGQRQYTDTIQRTGEYWAEWTYQNLVSTMIGLNPGTVLKHFPTALMNSVAQVGAGPFFREFSILAYQTLTGRQNWKFAIDASAELQRRARNWYETIGGAQYNLFRGGTTPQSAAQIGEFAANKLEGFRQFMIKFGATPVAFSDMLSAVASWQAAYKDAVRDGMDHGEAVTIADTAVRRGHGSTAVTARPYITRSGNPMVRAAAPFYTFFNEMLQRQYDTAWRAKDAANYYKRGEYEKGKAMLPKIAMGIWTYWAFQALVEQAISPIQFDEDEGYASKGAKILLHGTASSWPGIRDLTEFMLTGRDPSVSLYADYYKSLEGLYRDIQRGEMSLDEDHAGKTIKHFATAIGAITGLMNQQEGRWAQFAHDYSIGKQQPEGIPDWYRALRFGDITPPKE